MPVALINIRLVPVGTQPVPGIGGGATIRPIEDVDELVLAVKQLAASTTYTLYLSDAKTRLNTPEAVLTFKTDAEGKADVDAYYPVTAARPLRCGEGRRRPGRRGHAHAALVAAKPYAT